jgi:hypothetical protein
MLWESVRLSVDYRIDEKGEPIFRLSNAGRGMLDMDREGALTLAASLQRVVEFADFDREFLKWAKASGQDEDGARLMLRDFQRSRAGGE